MKKFFKELGRRIATICLIIALIPLLIGFALFVCIGLALGICDVQMQLKEVN